MAKELPTPCQLIRARDWLMAGAPSAARDFDAREAVKTLYLLIEALPAVLPVYCYGTPENRAALLKCEAEEDAAVSRAGVESEVVKAAVSDLTLELWGNQPPDLHAKWSHDRLQQLVRNLARAAGVTVPPWADV